MRKKNQHWLWLGLAFSFAFLLLSTKLESEGQYAFDRKFFTIVEEGPIDNLYYPITELASGTWLLFLSLALLLYFSWQGKGKTGLSLLLITLGAYLTSTFLKNLYHRPRPTVPLVIVSGYSFPSSHAFVGMVFYLSLASLYRGKGKSILTALAFVLALLIGASRVYLRVHYPTDVVAGWLGAWALLSFMKYFRVLN